MNVAMSKDIGSYITPAFGASGVATAAGAGDATEVDGAYVDRLGHDSGKLVITGQAVLTATKTISFAANAQDDADGASTGTDFGAAYPATIVGTGGGGGSTESFCITLDFDFTNAMRYIRAQVTPDLSHSGTDTVRWSAVWILGPKKTLPNQ